MQRLKKYACRCFVCVLDCVHEARQPFRIFSAVKTIPRNETMGFKITSIGSYSIVCVVSKNIYYTFQRN